MRFVKRNGRTLAFITLAIVAAIALRAVVTQGNAALYQGEIRQCRLVNQISIENNHRAEAGRASREVLQEFLQSARDARIAAFHATHQPTDEVAARSYSELSQRLDREVQFNNTPLINCTKAIPKP